MIDLRPISKFLLSKEEGLNFFDNLGFVNSQIPNLLTFISDLDYLESAERNINVSGVLWDDKLGSPPADLRVRPIIVSDSKLAFFTLQNSLKSAYRPNQISESASISQTAVIAGQGITIEEEVIIEDFVVVNPGSHIGTRSIVRSGSVIGSQALSVNLDEQGHLIELNHLGGVVIGDNVTIGSNSVIDRSIFGWDNTVLGDGCKVGCLSNISHGVKIGSHNNISAGANICGFTQIGNRNWIGPNVTISHMLEIGSDVFLSMGSVVLQNIQDGWKVVGSKTFKDRKLF